MVNIEANSQGTPAVSFNVEGCRDSIKDGVSGFVSNDENEFVKNILKIRKNSLRRSSIEYSKKFNWEVKAEEFYKELI